MSNLSTLLPVGSSGKTFTATASGAIPSKAPTILNSAGTVSEITKPTTNLAVGSRQNMYTPSAGQGPGMFSRYVYHVASGYVCAIYMRHDSVLAVKTGIPQSDNTITWGTEVTNSNSYNIYAAAYDSKNEKVIMVQAGSTGRVGAITVTSSGVPSWSAWKENTENTGTGGHVMLCFVPTHNVMLLHYQKSDDNNKVRTIDCSDDTPSNWVWGDIEAVNTSAGDYIGALKWDTANEKALLMYHDGGKAKQCVIAVGAASGDNITLTNNVDSTHAYSSGTHSAAGMTMCYDESREKFVIFWIDTDADPNGHQPFVSVGTISGTSCTWNTKVCWKSDSRILGMHSAYFPGGYHADNEVGSNILTWLDDGAGGIAGTYPHMTNFVVNSSGNVSNYASTIQMDSGYYYDSIETNDNEDHQMVCVDTVQKRFVAGYRRYKTTGNAAITPRLIDTWVGHPTHKKTTLSTSNFLGFADAAISNTASGDVVVRGGTLTDFPAFASVLGDDAAYNYGFAIYDQSITYIGNNKVVIAYNDQNNSNYGTAVVGTVSGTTISFGTPVVFEAGYTRYTNTTFDSNANKVVISYADSGNSGHGTAIVGTVSGTAISFGTAVVFESAGINYTAATFDSNANKHVIVYADNGNSNYGTAIVGTVSGTSISFGSAAIWESGNSAYAGATFDSNANKVVIGYKFAGSHPYNSPAGNGFAIVGTVSGTSISFGSRVQFNAVDSHGDTRLAFDSNANKVVIAHKNNTRQGKAVVGTVSGTSISFGSTVLYDDNTSGTPDISFNSSANTVLIAYIDWGESAKGTFKTGTVSGTSISFGSGTVFETANTTSEIVSTFNSDNNTDIIAYYHATQGTGIVYESAPTLTLGSNYYVQSDGTLSTSVDSPSVKAGLAISTTSLLLTGES